MFRCGSSHHSGRDFQYTSTDQTGTLNSGHFFTVVRLNPVASGTFRRILRICREPCEPGPKRKWAKLFAYPRELSELLQQRSVDARACYSKNTYSVLSVCLVTASSHCLLFLPIRCTGKSRKGSHSDTFSTESKTSWYTSTTY